MGDEAAIQHAAKACTGKKESFVAIDATGAAPPGTRTSRPCIHADISSFHACLALLNGV